MGWGDVLNMGLSAVSTGMGIYSMLENQSAADQAYNTVAGSAAAQDAMAREQWNRYKAMYGPLEQKQVDEAAWDIDQRRPIKDAMYKQYATQIAQQEKYVPLENQMLAMAGKTKQQYEDELLGQASADVANTFDKNAQIARRSATRMGRDVNSGSFADMDRQMQLDRSLAEVGLLNQMRDKADTMAWNRNTAALNYRQGAAIPQQASATGDTALNSAMSGLTSSANAMSRLGQTAADSASKGAQVAGWGASQLSGMFTPKQGQTTSTADGAWNQLQTTFGW